MSARYCTQCGRFMDTREPHKCSRSFEVIFPEHDEAFGDPGHFVVAYDHGAAAEAAVEKRNHRDAEFQDRENVHVREEGSSEIQIYRVEMETVPVYHAKRDLAAENPAPC